MPPKAVGAAAGSAKARPRGPGAASPPRRQPNSGSKAVAKERPAEEAVDRVGKYVLCLFTVRRYLSVAYFSAFISYAMQADGLFACDSPFAPSGSDALLSAVGRIFPPGLFLQIMALLGAALAGIAVVAIARAEESAAATFGALWLLYAALCSWAPQGLFDFVEDRILLEFGFIGALLGLVERQRQSAEGSETAALSRGAHQVARALSAWFLLRAIWAPAVEKLTGPCAAWRELRALADAYQLEPFVQQPTCWLLWLAPVPVIRALTFFQLYVDLVLPLVFVPIRAVSAPAAAFQVLGLLMKAALANYGCSLLVLAGAVFVLLDDSFHGTFWSDGFRVAWGCLDEEAEAEDSDNKKAEAKKSEGDGEAAEAEQKEKEEVGEAALWMMLLYIFVGIVGAAGVAFVDITLPRVPGEAPLAVAAALALVTALTVVVAMARTRCVLIGLVGLAVTGAGFVQLVIDLHGQDRLPAVAGQLALTLEEWHVAHTLGAGAEPRLCPQATGRHDVYVQGAVLARHAAADRETLESGDIAAVPRAARGQDIVWVDLSTRFLPNHRDDQRPVAVQPYSPRLERKLWELAHGNSEKNVLPLWMIRTVRRLAQREGAVVSLLAGPSAGWSAKLYGKHAADEDYVESRPLAMRVLRRRLLLDEDVHTNKWWNTTEWGILAQFPTDSMAKALGPDDKPLEQECVPTTFPWHEVPAAESMLALVLAVLLWRLLISG